MRVSVIRPEGLHEYRRRKYPIEEVLVHRIDIGETAEEIMDAFTKTNPELVAAFGKMPYHVVVERSGEAVSCVPVFRQAPHAYKRNPFAVGVAVVGDFRKEKPTYNQMVALHHLAYNMGIENWFGHTEVAGATSDPSKECPGEFLELDKIKDAAITSGRRAQHLWSLLMADDITS